MEQASLCVDALPSSQAVPSAFAVELGQAPVPGSQLPGVWHTESVVVHVTNVLLGVQPGLFLLSLVSVVALSLTFTAQALAWGVYYPEFESENAAQIPTSVGGLLFMLGALVSRHSLRKQEGGAGMTKIAEPKVWETSAVESAVKAAPNVARFERRARAADEDQVMLIPA